LVAIREKAKIEYGLSELEDRNMPAIKKYIPFRIHSTFPRLSYRSAPLCGSRASRNKRNQSFVGPAAVARTV
jgi:hypothetical protein